MSFPYHRVLTFDVFFEPKNIRISTCLSVCLSFCLSICLPVSVSVFLSLCLSLSLSLFSLSLDLSISLPLSISLHLSVYFFLPPYLSFQQWQFEDKEEYGEERRRKIHMRCSRKEGGSPSQLQQLYGCFASKYSVLPWNTCIVRYYQ